MIRRHVPFVILTGATALLLAGCEGQEAAEEAAAETSDIDVVGAEPLAEDAMTDGADDEAAVDAASDDLSAGASAGDDDGTWQPPD